ncbi:hypothetical protein [Streptomyces chartreusis]|uniref:hypothetical protein n=1 Tax=Streptomyces chartreusis TaxID=1969 RepID=UPI00364C8D39
MHLLTAEDAGAQRAWADVPAKQVAGNPRAIMFTWEQRDMFEKFVAAVAAAWRVQGAGL